MNENYHFLLYQRVKEIQPHLVELARGYVKDGMTPEEINIEICFAIMHEGYRLRDLKIKTHIDTHENNIQTLDGKDSTD